MYTVCMPTVSRKAMFKTKKARSFLHCPERQCSKLKKSEVAYTAKKGNVQNKKCPKFPSLPRKAMFKIKKKSKVAYSAQKSNVQN